MACFVAVAAEAIVVSAISAAVKKKEESTPKISINSEASYPQESENKISWSQKLSWLVNMLWGGVFLLAIEHIWHGEVVPWPPFLTAMNNPADIQPMLMEMLTVGGSMMVFVTAVWFIMTIIADKVYKKSTLMPVTSEVGGI